MTPAEARRRLRIIGASTRRAACPACGTPAFTPCPASPGIGHPERFHAAAVAYARRHGRYPPDFERVEKIWAAAYPLPRDSEPELTAGGQTILWRAAVTEDPYFGRGSYWTHCRAWAEAAAAMWCVTRPHIGTARGAGSGLRTAPYVLYRAEARITDANSCGLPDEWLSTLGPPVVMTHPQLGKLVNYDPVIQVDEVIRDDPRWPGCQWLIFARADSGQPSGYDDLLQYVYCGKRPIKAERVTS
ncbi:MAG TPA: hypothetical protein VHZ03_38205 [Trebonia sp.]|jgi:hypothetical protein|nr:hypothetical protein [Trebonia sp.]